MISTFDILKKYLKCIFSSVRDDKLLSMLLNPACYLNYLRCNMLEILKRNFQDMHFILIGHDEINFGLSCQKYLILKNI